MDNKNPLVSGGPGHQGRFNLPVEFCYTDRNIKEQRQEIQLQVEELEERIAPSATGS
jgi:hypothetical protein